MFGSDGAAFNDFHGNHLRSVATCGGLNTVLRQGDGPNIDPPCSWQTDRYRELGSPAPVTTSNLPIPMTIAPPSIVETITAKNFPMLYLPKPIKAQELKSKVEGATITQVAKDFPEELIKAGKAKELKSKWS